MGRNEILTIVMGLEDRFQYGKLGIRLREPLGREPVLHFLRKKLHSKEPKRWSSKPWRIIPKP